MVDLDLNAPSDDHGHEVEPLLCIQAALTETVGGYPDLVHATGEYLHEKASSRAPQLNVGPGHASNAKHCPYVNNWCSRFGWRRWYGLGMNEEVASSLYEPLLG